MLEEKVLEVMESRIDEVSVVVKDLKNNKWILKTNENKIFQSASTIKVPIMVEVLRQVQAGKYPLEKRIKVKNKDKVDFSIVSELDVEAYSVLDLLTLMIIISDNTATNILIDLATYESVNALMEEIKLKDTKLKRKMMDFQGIKEGRKNTTTAMDMANILEAIYREEILDEKHSALALNIMKKQTHKDSIARHLGDEILIANKTGSLSGLDHDVGIVYTSKTDYIIGVFTEKGKNNLLNKELIGSISKIVYDYIVF